MFLSCLDWRNDNMMNNDIYLEVVKEKFMDYMPEQYRNGQLNIHEVNKVNETLDGLTVLLPDNKGLCPSIYVNDLYREYKETGNLNEVLYKGAVRYAEALEMAKGKKSGLNIDPEQLKDNVVLNLINTEQNKELLADVPSKPFQDLSVIFRWVVSQDENGIASTIVNNVLMEAAGLTPDTLMEHAIENTKRIMPPKISSMEEVLMGMDPFLAAGLIEEREPKETMWVISNEQGINGAASMLYEENLHKLAEKVGTDLYLLPSSVHEWIAISTEMMEPGELAEMVQSVNAEQVELSERLSNNVYHYDKEQRKVTMATDVPNKRLDEIVAETPMIYDSVAKR